MYAVIGMVFRTPSGDAPELPSRTDAPAVVGFGIDGDTYVLFTARDGGLERWSVPTHATDTHCARVTIDGPNGREGTCLVTERAWLLNIAPGVGVGAPVPGDAVTKFAREQPVGRSFPVWIDGAIRVLAAKADEKNHPSVTLSDAADRYPLLGPFPAGNTARTLLAACATVHGPIAVFSTDRPDEVDLCALRDGGVAHKTVSLGHGQTFVCAAGGGSRVALVSRKGNDVRMRTVASDLRSELNPVPLAAGVRAEVGEVRVVHAGGPTFVLAHEERHTAPEVVVTVFEDGRTRVVRTKFPSVHGLALAGKHVAIASVTGGAMSPLLYVQQLVLARDDAKGESFASAPKRRAYQLGEPPTSTAQARRGALLDAAEVLSQSLAAQPPRELAVSAVGPDRERAAFIVPGVDPSQDLAVSVELYADGRAVVNVKIGHGSAPQPRPLTTMERVRVMLTGDDDGDPSTAHFELSSLARELGRVVMAVWALRLTR